ncbi:NADH-quinone oxidoreductase subunit NuoE [Candidatus Woesearchaeota archaeon]|nr:NADH-quinone oxidoreductase subunit NuoE [Candidatus Woesearchaeota archaeon]
MPDINNVIAKYSSASDLIPALQEIQEAFGYLSEENMEALSHKIKVPLAQISGVATFYSMFRLKPLGKHNIAICRGTACHVHDSETLLKSAEKKLNIKAGEITSDGMISLTSVNCIGACAKAPAIMVDGKVYGNLDDKKLTKIIEDLRKQG